MLMQKVGVVVFFQKAELLKSRIRADDIEEYFAFELFSDWLFGAGFSEVKQKAVVVVMKGRDVLTSPPILAVSLLHLTSRSPKSIKWPPHFAHTSPSFRCPSSRTQAINADHAREAIGRPPLPPHSPLTRTGAVLFRQRPTSSPLIARARASACNRRDPKSSGHNSCSFLRECFFGESSCENRVGE